MRATTYLYQISRAVFRHGKLLGSSRRATQRCLWHGPV